MAKMFYSMEEVQEKLGCTEAQIKEYVQNGQLREFRDGSKILFKVDEVDSLVASSGGDAIPDADIDLGLDLDGSSIGLAGSSIGLAPEDSFTADATAAGDLEPLAGDDDDLLAGSEAINLDGSSIGLAPTESEAGMYGLNDASSEGSVNLDAQMAEDSKPTKDDTVVTTHGIDALEDNEADADADPLAQTKVSSPMQLDDEISLDPGSSGSGLLDLSREADDTSLGADILKDIYDEGIGDLGGDDEKAPMLEAVDDDDDDAEAIAEPIVEEESTDEFDSPVVMAGAVPGAGGPRAAAMQIYDRTSSAFGFMMFISFVMLVYMAFNVVAFASGTNPGILKIVNDNMMWVTVGAGVVALLFLVIGLVMSGGGGGGRPAKAKPAKKEKVSKKKEKKTKAKKVRKKKK